MCGIAGLVRFHQKISEHDALQIDTVCRALRHRGPDAMHVKTAASNKAVLGGVRLRMTDSLNPKSDLPFLFEERYMIVFNGEIYNHKKLREKLPYTQWQTSSDTETLAAAYACLGEECLNELEGMFAFAIYDMHSGELFCARDITGQKPFYYMDEGDSIIFSSEINALLSGIDGAFEFCPRGIANFIANRMILGRDTHIKGISKLEPGCYMKRSANGDTVYKRYHKIQIKAQTRGDVESVALSIRGALEKSCAATFDMEHPPAILLSGGIDSTGVLAMLHDTGYTPYSYSIGFSAFEGDNQGIPSIFNEFDASRYVAKHYDTYHTELTVTPDMYLAAIDAWTTIMDEPLDATDAPLLYMLFERIAGDGYRLVYNGSGPDEIFDGYGHGASLSHIVLDDIAGAYCDAFSWNFGVEYNRLMPAHFTQARQDIITYFDDILSLYKGEIDDSLQAVQILNFHGRLHAYEFKQMDVTSMHFGIESRAPLIEKSIIDAAFDFAPRLKSHVGEEKWIYKQAWKGVVPEKIINREKAGFPTPMEFWFTRSFKHKVADALGAGALIRKLGILNDSYLDSLIVAENADLRALSYRLYCLEQMMQHQTALMTKDTNSETIISYKLAEAV